jgi:hypothetical protein
MLQPPSILLAKTMAVPDRHRTTTVIIDDQLCASSNLRLYCLPLSLVGWAESSTVPVIRSCQS